MANVPTKILKVAGRFGSYGEDGATFTPHLSDDGENITISYTNDKGLENPAPITFPKSALPKVTTADNGKILTVENGEIVFAGFDVDTEIPVFDLAAMGLSAVPLTGGSSVLETDTAAICAALDKGAVAFIIPFDAGGATMNATIAMNSASTNGMYQAISVVNYVSTCTVEVNVDAGGITVIAASLNESVGIPAVTADDNGKILKVVDGTYALVAVKDSSPTSIDLSGFENEGKIVETFADGTSKTTTVEFDADGNPVKITDGNGNITTLTW